MIKVGPKVGPKVEGTGVIKDTTEFTSHVCFTFLAKLYLLKITTWGWYCNTNTVQAYVYIIGPKVEGAE